MSAVNTKINQENIQNIQSDNQNLENNQKIEIAKSEEKIIQEKNEISIKDYLKKEFIICKKPISLKLLLIIGISAIILICLLIIIIVLATKKKKITAKESEPNLIDYYEAEKILGLERTRENHNLLNESSCNLDELTSICNHANFSEINISIGEIPENLNFLKDTTNTSLIVAREDLDLYISQYGIIREETNNLTKEVSGLMNKISSPLSEYKNEVDNLTEEFEKNIQNLAIPLISLNSSNIRNLESEELLEEYKKETKKLNNLYYNFFKKIKEDSENLNKAIKGIPQKAETLINKVNELLSSKEILLDIAMDTIHEGLIKLKEKFASYHDDLNILKNEIHSMGVEISKFSDSLGKEESNILENLKNLASQMGKSTMNLIPVILNFLNIDINEKVDDGLVGKISINKVKIYTTLGIYLLELGINKLGLVTLDVEASTSLDLLFIVDKTGSMQPYIDEVKQNMINIINGIIKECPGIDINLGFVGYGDFYEGYYNISFTKDHNYIKRIINNVYASGGGYPYYPDEDVAFGLELALNKDWKSNAKLAVFIADATAHGEKYGGHKVSSYYPQRREPDEMVMEMAEKSISLFCLKITNDTDIMFNIFRDIYNEKRQNNTLFQIIDNNNISFSNEIINYATKIYLEQRQNGDDGCLLDKKTSIEVLNNKYGIDNKNPDKNLRFILGKCSPVLLVPGVYATKLKVEFNCQGLASEERDTTLKNLRLFCGYDVCKDETKTSEEHPLLFSILEEAFGIEFVNNRKYGACLGHIMTYFQNENECPKAGNNDICHYSKFIKVGYYGGTTDSLKESRCGIEGISNVVQTGDLLLDSVIALIAKAAGSFHTISKNLINQKYEEGFSLAAVPNDFRRYLSTNNFATEVFKSQINRLYENTGKPVVIIAHSYGTLLTLTNLIKNQNDKTFMKKIKKFIAMAPPFAGSTKLLDIFLHTTKDFDKGFTIYPNFGQYLIYKSLPTIMELRPLSIAAKIFTDPSYEELGNALRDRLYCEENTCNKNTLNNKTSKFDEIFKGYFPSLLDSECDYNYYRYRYIDDKTLNEKCYTYIYNVGDCPTIITKSVNPDKTNFGKGLYCNKYGKGYFYQGECTNSERNCLDEMYYSDKCPNVYNNTNAIKFLLDRFNKNFSQKYGKIGESYFESFETIKLGLKSLIEHQKNIDLKKDLPIPPVDTELVYASFYPTMSVLVLDDDNFTRSGDNYTKGGDETVPTWSSLLTGLKWIYDKKKNNLSQNIKLIEYCSRLSKDGQYKYNPNKEQNFGAISCDCLNTDKNEYKMKEKEIAECNHAGMLHDKHLIQYIYSVINDPKETNIHTESKIEAAKKYDKYYDYVGVCNNDIYNILANEK